MRPSSTNFLGFGGRAKSRLLKEWMAEREGDPATWPQVGAREWNARSVYRVAQNHDKQVLRISHTILSFLDEIASTSQQLPFFTRSAQLPLLSKVSCSDLFAHEE